MLVSACTSPSPSRQDAATGGSSSASLDHEIDAYLQLYKSSLRVVLATVDGRPVLQRYSQTTPVQTRDVHSVTKSVVSALIGIALAEGLLRSPDQKLAELLPAYRSQMNG